MALIKIPYLLKILESENLIYWKVTDGAGMIDQYNAVKGNADESMNTLQECLDNLEGYYNVDLTSRNSSEVSKGGDIKSASAVRKFRVKCEGKNISENISGQTNNQDTGKLIGELKAAYQENAKLQNQIQESAMQQQFQKLQDQISALTKKLNDPDEDEDEDEDDNIETINGIERILNHPIVMKLSGSMFNNQTKALAGGEEFVTEVKNNSVSPEFIADAKHKCAIASGRLLKCDINAGDSLLLLAELAEKKPEIYQMAKQQIQNFL